MLLIIVSLTASLSTSQIYLDLKAHILHTSMIFLIEKYVTYFSSVQDENQSDDVYRGYSSLSDTLRITILL
jgi:hypothetical protein